MLSLSFSHHHPCLSDNDTLSLSSPLLSSPSLSSLYPVPSDNNSTLILTSSNDNNGDGTLALTSSDNDGSTFTLTLSLL